MNGAPGGRQQCGAAPSQGAALPSSSLRSNVHPTAAATAGIFAQPDDGPSNGQHVGHIIPSPQALSLSGVAVQQTAGARDSSFPILQPSGLQQPGGWPPQLDLQSLYSSQLHTAQTTALRFGQAASSQPSVCSELTMAASPHSSLASASPASASASALTGMGIGPSSAAPASSHSSPSALQMMGTAAGSLNPAILAQYQLLLAAAAQQQQQQAAAAAAALAASSGQQSPLASRISSSPISGVPFEQNIQRYLLQLQQQQQQLAAAASSQLVPSSALHNASPLSAHMRAALAAANAFPQTAAGLAAAGTQPRTVSSMVASSSSTTPSPTALSSEVTNRTLSESSSVLQSQIPAKVLQRQSPAAAAASTSLTASTSSGGLSSNLAQRARHAQYRGSLMPPPPLPRSRHASLSLPSTSQIRQRPSALPYQRPVPNTDAPFEMGTLPSQPYYPSHFMRGTVIRLQSGQLKRVEEMSTSDFVLSAAMKSDLSLCNSTVVRIQEADKERHVLVTFAVGEQKIQVSIEAGIEYPYFVVGQGWASCSPEKTRNSYGLICKQLAIGDVCITIRHTSDEGSTAVSSSDMPYTLSEAGSTSAETVARSSLPTPLRGSGRGGGIGGSRSAPPQPTSTDDSAFISSNSELFGRHRRKSST